MRETLELSWHLVVRNWQVYKKDFLANISPTVTDPIFAMLAFGLGLGPYMAQVEGHPYRQYLAPGIVVTASMFTAYFETSYGFFVKMTFENIFKAMLTTPISAREVVVGELVWVTLKGAAMAGGISLVLACFGLFNSLPWLLAMPFIGGAVSLACGGMGLICCCFVNNIDQFQLSYAYLILPLYFFSGIFFPVTQTPGWLQAIVNLSPVYHGARLAQMAFWNEFHWGEAALHIAALLLCSAILVPIANRLVRKKLIK
ncbi:MAG TPA: ABC transporter permease [Opitutales bacterium]|nr:ABC transporter permease [Opitutales bacterium]